MVKEKPLARRTIEALGAFYIVLLMFACVNKLNGL